jgi:glycosyltransferase involved in cell wall biosynthesis
MAPSVPNPRMQRRSKTLSKKFKIYFNFWDRGGKSSYKFNEDGFDKTFAYKTNSDTGLRLSVIIPFIKYLFYTFINLFKVKPQIIHAFRFEMLLVAYIYVLFNRETKIVYEIADLPSIIYPKEESKIKIFISKIAFIIEKFIINKISFLILTSEQYWNVHYKELVSSSKFIYIPNVPKKKIFNNFKKKTDYPNNITVGLIGNIRYFDQLENLVDVSQKFSKIDLFFAGILQDENRFNKIIEGKENIEYFGPYDYKTQIKHLNSKIDLIYCVYDTNDFNAKVLLPNKLYESILCEIPIVVSKNTEVGRFVKEKNIGYLVDDKSKKELINLFENDLTLESMEEKSKNCSKIKKDYYAEKYEKILLNKITSLI